MFVHEWPLGLFIKFYPDYLHYLNKFGVDLTDPDYIVRVEYREDGSVNEIEVGYATDKWHLKV